MFSISRLDSLLLELAVKVCRGLACSVEHATLIGGDHILNVNECIISTVHLEKFESLHNDISQILALALRVIDLVSLIQVLGLEEVHDGQDLSVVGHESLANSVTALNQSLEDMKSGGNNLGVTSAQCR